MIFRLEWKARVKLREGKVINPLVFQAPQQ